MAKLFSAFQNDVYNHVSAVTSTAQALETWAGNKSDSNPNFDYTSAAAAIAAAEAAYMTAIQAVTAT